MRNQRLWRMAKEWRKSLPIIYIYALSGCASGPRLEVECIPPVLVSTGRVNCTAHLRGDLGKDEAKWLCPSLSWYWPAGSSTHAADRCDRNFVQRRFEAPADMVCNPGGVVELRLYSRRDGEQLVAGRCEVKSGRMTW